MLAASLPAVLGTAACDASATVPSATVVTGPATIKLTTTWTSGMRGTVMKELIGQFQQAHPQVTVEEQVVTPAPGSSYADAVFVQLPTASAADVIQGDPQTMPRTGKSLPVINDEPQMVYGQSRAVDAAFQWVKFTASKDVQLKLATTSGRGVIPSLKSVARSDAWLGQYPDLKKVTIEASEKAVTLPFHGKYQRWQTAIQAGAARAFRGELSAREAMLEATREGDKILAGQ